ncbi:hypothetical protein [Novosphingobium sp. PhB165]|uniref:hypothetical protein n=1 Tax=Novosphingobium sp. PhB165 TaxID=2485105 RepID=UPI00104B767A|nr:hypothetical protein [Novosphingobium sp. PhB165]
MLGFIGWRLPELVPILQPYRDGASLFIFAGAIACYAEKGDRPPTPAPSIDWSGALVIMLCGIACTAMVWLSGWPERVPTAVGTSTATLLLSTAAGWFAYRNKGRTGEARFDTAPKRR